MPVHKRIAGAIKKKLPKRLPKIPKLPKVPKIPRLPAIPAGLRPWVGMAKRPPNPYLLGLSLGYYGQKYTRPYWGPPTEAIGERMGEEARDFYDWVMPQGDTEIDPQSEWFIPEGYGAPMMPAPAVAPKRKRKVSKANKAMKMAYNFYRKKVKGKMTQKKCRELMRKASKMASKANPHTKTRIGKGGDWIKRHCRKVRKGVWNTSKRSY